MTESKIYPSKNLILRLKLSRVVKSKVILLVLLVFLPIAIYQGVSGDFLKLSNINCKTQYGECSEKDLKSISQFTGRNLFLVKVVEVEGNLLRDYMNRKVVVEKRFPQSLVIDIEKRKALVAFKSDLTDEGAFLVDRDGIILEFVRETASPIMLIKQGRAGLALGGSLGEAGAKSTQLLYLTNRIQPTKNAELLNGYLLIVLQNGVEVDYPTEKDPKVLVGALQLILNRSKMESKLPKVIDLRYNNPVVKY